VTIWRMRIACWMPQAIDAHSEYVTLTAFPQQQWLCERASLLRYSALPVYPIYCSIRYEQCSINSRLKHVTIARHLRPISSLRRLIPYYSFLCLSVLPDATILHVRHFYVQETIIYCICSLRPVCGCACPYHATLSLKC
jgi:hypothetical protein